MSEYPYRGRVFEVLGQKPNDSHVRATPEEEAQCALQYAKYRTREDDLKFLIKQCELELETLRADCTHKYIADMDGFLYYSRGCAICGTHLEMI